MLSRQQKIEIFRRKQLPIEEMRGKKAKLTEEFDDAGSSERFDVCHKQEKHGLWPPHKLHFTESG